VREEARLTPFDVWLKPSVQRKTTESSRLSATISKPTKTRPARRESRSARLAQFPRQDMRVHETGASLVGVELDMEQLPVRRERAKAQARQEPG